MPRPPTTLIFLQAAFFALKAFCQTTSNTHVQLQIDNTTAVGGNMGANMGGSKSTQLNNLAKEMWIWCINKNIWVSAVHIAGKLNTSADNKSRNFSDKHEWALNKEYFQEIISVYPELNIDLLASRLNHQLDFYCSWKPDPGCTYADAFSIDWSNFCLSTFQSDSKVCAENFARQGTGNTTDPCVVKHKSNKLRKGENWTSQRKTSRSRVENQQTQPKYDAGSGN